MAEALDTPHGMKTSATQKTLRVVKSGDSSGIQNALQDSTMLPVVSVLLIVRMDRLISGFRVKRNPMEEELDIHLPAEKMSNTILDYATLHVEVASMEWDPSVGKFVKLANLNVVLSVLTLQMDALIQLNSLLTQLLCWL